MKRSGLLKCVVLLICFSPILSHAQTKYWVYFSDKGIDVTQQGISLTKSPEYRKALSLVRPKALERRLKILPSNQIITPVDFPLHQPYIDRVQTAGGILVHQIRWMNAASFFLTDEQILTINNFPFVTKVSPVVILRARKQDEVSVETRPSPRKTSTLDYGPSFTQAQMINVPQLHDFGVNGKGVIVGMLDTGFRWRTHEALQTRNVIAEHDFIFNDDTTANQAGDSPSQHNHGTLVFSVAGGYMPGKLIGPAYGSDYVLGKTEYLPTETQIEEDNWAAGIEWMENQGVDVVSSSLGYDIFDDNNGYRWSNGDFNGRTSVTALAALHAARLGVAVCVAMGNNGNNDGFIGSMLTPADADSIISVGAVDFGGNLAGFSSTGPTNDGRIKPDVVAPGVGVYYAGTSGSTVYGTSSGTSLSTPLVAGTAALMLSARPELTPIQVRDALRSTADSIDIDSYPDVPNNFTGWGLVNALNAALSFGPIFSNEPTIDTSGLMSVVSIGVMSKFGIDRSTVKLWYGLFPSTDSTDGEFTDEQMTLTTPMVFPTSGTYSATIPLYPKGTSIYFWIEARDSGSHGYRSPLWNKLWQLQYGLTDVGTEPVVPTTFELLQNYPNPFNPSTNIEYRISHSGFVLLKVFDILGREVATLLNETKPPGVYKLTWNASNQPSGVYFYRLATSSSVLTRKMILLR